MPPNQSVALQGTRIGRTDLLGEAPVRKPTTTGNLLSLIVYGRTGVAERTLAGMHGNRGETDIRARFGRAVRARRRSLGITQELLAERAGLHRVYVAEVELGKRNVSLVNIERLAAALSVSIPDLFPKPEAKQVAEGSPDYGD